MPPGTDGLKKRDIGRTDRVNSRVPAVGKARGLIFNEGNTQAGVAQRQGQAGTSQPAANYDQIKMLHDGDYAASRE